MEGCAAKFLIRGAIGEAVGDWYLREVLENAALHGQFVQVTTVLLADGDIALGGSILRIQKRENALRQRGGAVHSHGVVSCASIVGKKKLRSGGGAQRDLSTRLVGLARV